MKGDASFLPGARRWADALGGLRDTVRQELVAAQLAEAVHELSGGAPLRVLDIGCGQGTQALRLAQAGHEITGLDISDELLGRFASELSTQPLDVRARVRLVHGPGEAAAELAPGPFDLVLCHGVLMYLDEPLPMLRAIGSVAADGAVISLLVRNGIAPAMRDGLRGRWADALTSFDSPQYVNRLGLPARGHTPEELDAAVARLGWRRRRWYGVRVFTDAREQPAASPDELDRILAVEHEAARRDPYRAVAALLHLLYHAPAPARGSEDEAGSVPLAAGEAPERDEPDEGDDQPDPEAPDDHQDDPDDHEDAAEGDPADTAAAIRSSHLTTPSMVQPR